MEDDRALIASLTEFALERAAPEELVVFDETAQEFFADPQAALTAANKDSAVGFGLELAMLTPVALAVGSAVVQALSDWAVAGILRRFGRKRSDIVLTPDQARHVRQVALDRARSLGVPDNQAALLADSFVGAIATTS